MPSGPTVTFSRLLWDVFISGCPCASHQPAAFCRFPLVLLLPFLAFICDEVSRDVQHMKIQFQIYHGYQIMKYSILNLSWLSTHETYKLKYIMEYICCQINCDIRLDSCSAISRHPHTSYRCHTVPPSQALPSPSCSLHNRYQYPPGLRGSITYGSSLPQAFSKL